jgi:hypothetical protein
MPALWKRVVIPIFVGISLVEILLIGAFGIEAFFWFMNAILYGTSYDLWAVYIMSVKSPIGIGTIVISFLLGIKMSYDKMF